MRATSMPARAMRASTAGSALAGPTVAMILVRRTAYGALDGEGRQHCGGVPLDLDPAEYVFDLPLAIDHERRALDAPERTAVHVLLLVDAVLAADRRVDVGQEREGQVVLLREALVAQLIVQADPQHDAVLGLDAGQVVAEGAGLH